MTRARITGETREIDRDFPDVGRIHIRKKMDRGLREDYNAMLTALYRQGRHDVLRALVARTFTVEHLYAAFAGGGIAKLPTAESLVDFRETWDRWLARLSGRADHSRQSAEHLRRHLNNGNVLARALGKGATLRDLPRTVKKMREDYGDRPRGFNYIRSSVQAFLRDVLGKDSPLYLAIAATPILPAKRQRLPNPQTIAQMVALEAVLAPELMAAAWAMATTGMIPKEYWLDGWSASDTGEALFINGTKRSARKRIIPNLGRCTRPAMDHRAFQRALHVALGGAVVPKDFRNTFAVWMGEAGIPRARRKVYLGHTVGDITDLYEQHEIVQYLKEDRERFSHWLAEEEAVARGGIERPKIAVVR